MAHGTAMFISSVPVSSDHWKKEEKNRSIFFLKNKLFFPATLVLQLMAQILN